MRKLSDLITQRSTLELTIACYVSAAIVRLLVAILRGLNTTPPEGDEWGYYVGAMRIIEGLGYSRLWSDGLLRPSAHQMPGASAFIGIGMFLFGKQPASAYLMAVLISSTSVPLMFIFARRMASTGTALIAALACMIYPTWVYYSTSLLTEPFFIPILMLALILTSTAVSLSSSRTALLAGATWGVATLVRPHGAPMAMLVVIYLWWRRGWRQSAILSLGCLIVIGPWVIRNYQNFGAPVLATESGETFLGSNNPYVVQDPRLHGMWQPPSVVPEYRAAIEFNYAELERSKIQNSIAWTYLRENPEVIPRLAFYKVRRWLTPVTVSGGVVRWMVLASYGPLLIFLLTGLSRRTYRWSVELQFVLMWSFIMTAITVVWWGNLTRGRLPLEMVWIPWAAVAATDVFSRFLSRRRSGESPRPTAAVSRPEAHLPSGNRETVQKR